MVNKYQCDHCDGTGEAPEATGHDLGIMPLTDFDVWWCDQPIGDLDTKDQCKRQWVAMDRAGLDCSDITQAMDETWADEFARREKNMKLLANLRQEFDAALAAMKETGE